MRSFLKKYHISIVTIVVIWVLSLYPFPRMEFVKVPFLDKWTHAAMYGGLCTIIWCQYLYSHRNLARSRAVWGAIILPAAMSGLLELIQEATGYRSGDWFDFLANLIGVLLAAGLANWVLRPLFAKRFS